MCIRDGSAGNVRRLISQTGKNRRTPPSGPRKCTFLPLRRNCKVFLGALAFKLITQTGDLLSFSIISSQLEKWLLFFMGLRLVRGEAELPELPLAQHGLQPFVLQKGNVLTPPSIRRLGQRPARSPWLPSPFQLQFLAWRASEAQLLPSAGHSPRGRCGPHPGPSLS